MTTETGAARKGRPAPSVRLLARLRAMGLPVPEDADVVRTYAGRHQRAAGAWSWQVWPQGGLLGVGSQYPAGELARVPRLVAVRYPQTDYDWHVFPWDDSWDTSGATRRLAGFIAEPDCVDRR